MSFIQPGTPNTTNTASSFYPTTNSPSSDGSISSCSDNSIFSVNSGYSTASSSIASNPSKPSPNISRHLKSTLMTNIPTTANAVTAAFKKNMDNLGNITTLTERIPGSKQLPSPPGHSPSPRTSYLGKRRHSADEVMFLSLPPARRGIVNTNSSATPEKPALSPPLAALPFEFTDDSFRRDSTGRLRIEVVPTPIPVTDDMELCTSEKEDELLKNNNEDDEDEDKVDDNDSDSDSDSDLDRFSVAGSPLYELGEPVKPFKEHTSHPFHSLEKKLMCKMCQQLMLAPHGLACGHAFCGLCLALWIDGAKTKCYECDASILPTQRSMIPNFKLDSAVELVAKMILDESEMEVRYERKLEWLRYSYSRMPGVRHYSALLHEQYAMLLRGIQDTSVCDSKTDSTSIVRSAIAPGPKMMSKPIPIPKGPPRSN